MVALTDAKEAAKAHGRHTPPGRALATMKFVHLPQVLAG
jgi:hypothetical protein